MATACFTNCIPENLIGLPVANCATDLRRTTPSRLFMYNCDVTLPTGPGIGAAMAALFEDGTIVSSMPLSNVVFEDPTYEEILLNDCQPPEQLLQTRAMTFEDRYAIDVTGQSPFVENRFFDYEFWVDKLANQQNIRFMLAYCNGDVREIDFVGTLRGFVNYIKPQQAGAPSTETKQFRLLFNGDPLAMTNPPVFNYIDAGIIL